MTDCCYSLLKLPFSSFPITDLGSNNFPQRFRKSLSFSHRSSKFILSAISRTMEVVEGSEGSRGSSSPMKLLFVEMGVGYDQHGQDITVAAMRACKDAISSNSIPAFRRGSIPGVSFDQMKLQIKLGVPHSLQKSLDMEKVKSVFPYGEILNVEVVDGGLICSSGVLVEEMGDKNDDCYIVNAAVYVGSIPGVTSDDMKLQQNLDKDKMKSVFPYGQIMNFEVVDGGLVCSTQEVAEKNDDCYIVNAAVYVGY